MAYTIQTWINDNPAASPLSATRLGNMENGIKDADNRVTVLEPRPQTITYAATITPDATLGNMHFCVATGNLTVNEPTGGTNGQTLTLAIQASGGIRTVSWSGGLISPVVIPSGEWRVFELRYVSAATTWLVSG